MNFKGYFASGARQCLVPANKLIFRGEETVIKEFYYNPEVDITSVELENGMKILIKNMAGSEMISINLWINVGSNNEPDNMSGISHFIEHMLFKGTEKRKVGEMSIEIEALGGYLNGFTSYEATAYQITVPKANLFKALEILFDALENSSFDSLEIKKEAQVIIEECKMRDDTPAVLCWENFMRLAYKKHRYRKSIIGEENLIVNFSREDLLNFYKHYYCPGNITLILAGEIEVQGFIKQFSELYENFRQIEVSHDLSPQEPLQRELRYNYLRGDIERTYINIGFHIPNQLHSDAFTMEVLSFIMGQGRSSRLYQEIKETKQLVTSISASNINGRDPGVFIISAITDENKVLSSIKTIWNEIEKFKYETVRSEELEKAKTSIEHDYLFALETVDGQTDKIGYWSSLGDYTMSVKYLDILKKISPEDIKEVASRYFNPDNCSINIYAPLFNGEKDSLNMSSEEMKTFITGEKNRTDLSGYDKKTLIKKISPVPEKIILKNGVTLLVEVDKSLPVACVYGAFSGGVRFEPREKNGLSRLMNKLLIKGTKNRKAREIASDIESLGSYLYPRSGKDTFALSMSLLKRYLKDGLEIFFDVLNNPVFPEEEIEKEKVFTLAEIREKNDDPMRLSIELCDSLVFKNHPYGMSTTGDKKSISKIQREDLVNFYNKYIHGENFYISVVGDVSTEEIIYIIENSFSRKPTLDWHSVTGLPVEPPATSIRKSVKKRDIRQSSITTGFLGPEVTSEDCLSFMVLNSILSGMGSRLFIELRDNKGLAYAVFCYLDYGMENSCFKTYIATGPNLEKEAIKGILYELKKVKDEGVFEHEVQKAKNVIKGKYQMNLQERIFRASRYSTYEIIGLGYERVRKFSNLIDKVTLQDVNRVASKYLDLENYSIAIIRPKYGNR